MAKRTGRRREPHKRWADFPGIVLEELESKKKESEKKETDVVENRLRDTGWGRGRRGRDDWREKHGSKRTTVCKPDKQWKFAARPREYKLRLCNHLEGWERVGGESTGRGNMYTYG